MVVALGLDLLVDLVAVGEPLVAVGSRKRALVGEAETAVDGDPVNERERSGERESALSTTIRTST